MQTAPGSARTPEGAPRPTVFLFDIDGTLLLSGGAGRRSFERAFAEITGRPDALKGFSFAGMTDKGIARAGLTALGREVDEGTVEQLFAAYLHALADELLRSNLTIMPGVPDVLAQLAERRDVAIGLGTGNLRRGAEAKLVRGDMWHLFGFGGFGCDHEDRGQLLQRGLERGAASLGRAPADCRVVVIGDTVRDVTAAHAIGARCVAVETGGISREVLQAAGADVVYKDLTQRGVMDSLLIG
jgi:phosphoglycolate phosphatase